LANADLDMVSAAECSGGSTTGDHHGTHPIIIRSRPHRRGGGRQNFLTIIPREEVEQLFGSLGGLHPTPRCVGSRQRTRSCVFCRHC